MMLTLAAVVIAMILVAEVLSGIDWYAGQKSQREYLKEVKRNVGS